VDDAGGTTIFWLKKPGAPGLVDAYCHLIIAYTTYIKLNWRPFLGATSHFSEYSNHFLMVYIMRPSRNSIFDSRTERDTDLISSYILCPCSLPSVSHIIHALGQASFSHETQFWLGNYSLPASVHIPEQFSKHHQLRPDAPHPASSVAKTTRSQPRPAQNQPQPPVYRLLTTDH
jgi:hypothetical protein